MTSELTEDSLCQLIEKTIKSVVKTDTLSEPVNGQSRMGSPREWDSLSFVAIFMAVGAEFDVELDDDDAIHFQSVQSIHSFLLDILDA